MLGVERDKVDVLLRRGLEDRVCPARPRDRARARTSDAPRGPAAFDVRRRLLVGDRELRGRRRVVLHSHESPARRDLAAGARTIGTSGTFSTALPASNTVPFSLNAASCFSMIMLLLRGWT